MIFFPWMTKKYFWWTQYFQKEFRQKKIQKEFRQKKYFWQDSIFSKRIPAKNIFKKNSSKKILLAGLNIFEKNSGKKYFQKDFRQKNGSIFSKRIPAKNTTFGMIFEKSPENGDFEILLVGPKFHQTFKPITILARIKRYMVQIYTDT